ncbi:LysR family transcriptional regulator [Nakamurella sp.]|uniref:LysR family transcriptional regulator n=1 Tax=Nakamurella sp. TaxID=1869182 RepID=UPI003B3A0418
MDHSIDLDLVRTLVEVHRTGSMTAAAVRLGMSQPAVTAHVRALEKQLGRVLFVRQPRGVTATPFAEMIAGEATPHVDALDRLISAPPPDRDPVAGHAIAIGGPAEFSTAYVVPALAPLVARGLSVRFTLGLPEDLVESLIAGHIDLAILTVPVRRRGVTLTPLCDEELILIGAPPRAARLAPRLASNPSDEELTAEPLIAYGEHMPLIRRYWNLVFGSRPTGRPAMVVPDLRGVLTAVSADAGIAVVPAYLGRPAVERGEVARLMSPALAPINTLSLAASGRAMVQAHTAVVHSFLTQAGRTWGTATD